MKSELNSQEKFWQNNFGKGYIERNKEFNAPLLEKAWSEMLTKANGITSILEAGSNIGRNLSALKNLIPGADLGLIEINKQAFDIATSRLNPSHSFNGCILDSKFEKAQFDLTYSCGVMIHIAPDELKDNLEKLYQYSNKYIVLAEYFNRTPVSIDYHGEKDKLFKRDFGKFFLENFDAKVIDYGFLWSEEYQNAGFDDMTWWLFEKNNNH